MGNRGKVVEKNRAQDLRAKGWTYTEIAAEVAVSKSSVSLWCRDVEVDPALLDARRRANYERGNYAKRPSSLRVAKLAEIEHCRTAGVRLAERLDESADLMLGIGLYAGDGSKGDGAVHFANSDPALIAFFCGWLRRHFDIDDSRLRLCLYLHEGLDIESASTFWLGVTSIPLTQFRKPYRAVADPSIRRAKHVNGCAHIRYNCTHTQRKILGLIDGLLASSFLPG